MNDADWSAGLPRNRARIWAKPIESVTQFFVCGSHSMLSYPTRRPMGRIANRPVRCKNISDFVVTPGPRIK